MCCVASTCCPCCTICKAGMDAGAKYGIKEGCCAACIKAWLCGPCYSMQIVNEIMLKERLNYGCIFVEKDSGAPTFTPAATEMART